MSRQGLTKSGPWCPVSTRKPDSMEFDPVDILFVCQPAVLFLVLCRRRRGPIEHLLHTRKELLVLIREHAAGHLVEPKVIILTPKLLDRPGPSQQPINHADQFAFVV